jgi:3-hydroxyisobutyrate dehydrogenase-like beta-hydroxyacid dehydrogenase
MVTIERNDRMKQNIKFAVLGLRAMGSRMALNWLNAGYEVIVWNRTPHKTERLKAENAKVAATPRDAAHRADVVVAEAPLVFPIQV